MDVLKKLKSVFIVEDPTANNNESVQEPKVIDARENPVVAQESSSIPEIKVEAPVSGSTPDPKFVEILLKAIEENNLEGFDYLEYKSSLQSLSKMNMDDATRYQSAMAMAKTMGANKAKVLQSANHYLQILSKENDKFQGAVQAQRSKVDQDQQTGIKSIQASIENKKKQIEQLTKEIELESQKLEEMKKSIDSGLSKIAETTSKFNYAYKIVSQQIAEDMKNISSYITNE